MNANSLNNKLLRVFYTIRDGQERLREGKPILWSSPGGTTTTGIYVNSRRTFQKIEGIGGALTEAALERENFTMLSLIFCAEFLKISTGDLEEIMPL